MNNSISISLHYETKRKEKVAEFIQNFSIEYELAIKVESIGRYDKFDNQFRAEILLETAYNKKEDLVYFMLQLAQIFNRTNQASITVKGPIMNGQLSFEVIINQEVVGEPIKWVLLQVD